MSRTYRRKNFEYEGFNGRYWYWRCESEQEFAKQFWRLHSDHGGPNSWTPGRSYRQVREERLRSFNKQELIKFVNQEDYEPMCMNLPLSHMWDWS